MQKFGRSYALYVGVNSELSNKNVPKGQPPKVVSEASVNSAEKIETDYTTIPEQAAIITAPIRITAEIGQSKKGVDKTMFTLTNVPTELSAKFKRDATVIFKAGYLQDFDITFDDLGTGQEALPTVYIGQVHSVKTEMESPDIITKLYCTDGSTVRRNVRVSKSWPPGTTNKEIINDLVAEAGNAGIPKGAVRLDPENTTTTLDTSNWGGYSASGNLYEELGKVTKANGLEMYHAQGKLFVNHPRATGQEAYLLRPENIIGKVTVSNDVDEEQSNAEEGNENTVEVEVWLDSSITVDKFITLEDTLFDGDYKVVKVKHSIDTRGDKYTTTVTGVLK